MDPISIGIGVIGLGMSIFGGMQQADVAKQQAQVSRDIAGQEQGINDEKQKAMEISGRRQQLEIMRNTQRAQAQATNNAVNQGAQFGSGLQGGLAQVADQGLFNITGVNLGLETGRSINTYNRSISQDKMKMADLGGDMAEAQGWSSLGGAIMKSGPMIGSLSKGFGGGFGGGGNYSGTVGSSNTGGIY